MYLGENIRYLRIKKGYSQDFIAEKLGYKSFTTIQKWESGVSEPPVKKLKELSDLLGVDMDDMNNKRLSISEEINSINKESDSMTFGERLIILRKENGYNTRNDFAEKLGIPSTTLRNYETNLREPGHTFLKTISSMFGVSVDYLLCLTDEKALKSEYKLTKNEFIHIDKYRAIDNDGKKVVDTILDREYERATLPMLKAAHERTDIEVTDEMKQHDEDIMNDENF